jgi:hypothetical protein
MLGQDKKRSAYTQLQQIIGASEKIALNENNTHKRKRSLECNKLPEVHVCIPVLKV